MPELPEVETVRRGVEPHVLGQRILRALVREPRLRWPVPPDFAAWVAGRRIVGTDRRGKYLLLLLEGEPGAPPDRLIVHLGMSGRLLVVARDVPLRKHDHLDLELEGGLVLRYHDPRRFGAVLPWPAAQGAHPLMETMGPEPFSADFHGDYLFQRSRGKSAAVKTFLMDGGVVVGAGNIYAAESLFRAGIRPTRPAGKLTRAEYARLAERVREVLAEAVEQGGTTLRDFAGADGRSGYFQQDLYVYGREGEACRVCGTAIKSLRLGNRQSCYCPRCQR
ncbi:MAG: bifunctional DNA-formamidopyrimidine glycosylase/DNA-(apurinic or apyrimidinic site) lyase [Nevskiaceae bacterium]|nr:MAG: bifunctional DNA-formamidopyrimidine glycosylase/DNA-(apurinic or apyrimidinic site) lyase [Nevskiaceae bacterium]TAM27287.1 MAG: bifunctional DNA-formamidopyrimidine glycosylase/DNA-(apurinic or apyrimidinic site) lyase [Nevskiaceae bacterium]